MTRKSQIPILLFVFISIFEPPFLPIQFIYFQGSIELIYLLFFKVLENKRVDLSIPNQSKMSEYYLFIFSLWCVLSISRIIDIIFFNGELSLSNWLKSTNQYLILTFIEFMNLGIMFNYFKNRNYSLDEIFDIVINAGVIQGITSLVAFFVPTIRMAFLKFAGDVYNNSWLLERRGYGFSQSLLDGFGYGMGLIAGLLILNLKFKSGKQFLLQIIKLSLIIFSILVNSRTGIIVFMVAIILKIAISDSLKITLIKLPITIIVLYVLVYSSIPLINLGMASMNTNINWIASDIGGLIKAFIPSANINTTVIQAHATSNPYLSLVTNVQLPNNTFQFLFGRGWQVYEGSQTGYRSDNGFINMFWMVGAFGTIAYYLYNAFITLNLFNSVNKKYYLVLIFNYIALLVYSIKGRPIGYSSGIVIFYLIIFSLTYFDKLQIQKKENN